MRKSVSGTYTATTTGPVVFKVYNWRSGFHTVNVENWIDNLSVTPQNASMTQTTNEIPASAGGSSTFNIDAGPAFAGKTYVVMSSITGTYPGFTLNGLHIPLNFDAWTSIAFNLINTPVMSNFKSTLDANGQASATFLLPMPEASATGLALYFNTWVVQHPTSTPVIFVTNPIYVLFTP